MLLLVVDTAGPTGGVLLARWETESQDRAVIQDGLQISQDGLQILGSSELQPRAFSIQMIPAIAGLLQASTLRLTDVDGFAVVSGPGSFTGLRVGLSTVKAMAEVTGKPILALSHLAILASVASGLYPQEPSDAPVSPDAPVSVGTPVHTVLDAGRGEFYHGVYRNAGKTCVREAFQTLDTLAASIQSEPGLVVASEPAARHALDGRGILAREVPSITVRDALPLAVVAWRAGEFHDSVSLDANYLRRSDAVVVSRPPSTRATRATVRL